MLAVGRRVFCHATSWCRGVCVVRTVVNLILRARAVLLPVLGPSGRGLSASKGAVAASRRRRSAGANRVCETISRALDERCAQRRDPC